MQVWVKQQCVPITSMPHDLLASVILNHKLLPQRCVRGTISMCWLRYQVLEMVLSEVRHVTGENTRGAEWERANGVPHVKR
jgi:hypothetical protein